MEKMNKYEIKIIQEKNNEMKIISRFKLQQDWDIWACTMMQQQEFLEDMHNSTNTEIILSFHKFQKSRESLLGECTIQSVDGINTKIITYSFDQE